MLRAIIKGSMATAADAKAFMSSPHFAVVGASSDPTKFGHKGTSLPLIALPFLHRFVPLVIPLVAATTSSLREAVEQR